MLTIIGTNTKVSSDRVINNFVLPTGEGPYAGGLFAPDSTWEFRFQQYDSIFYLNIFSEYRKHYLGNQFLPEKMGNLDIGPKETTGPVRNENGYTQTSDDSRRFITTYQIKYFEK